METYSASESSHDHLCKWFVLEFLLVLKERVQAVLFHDDLRLVREEDCVPVKSYFQLCVGQLVLHISRCKHGCCSNACL